MTRFEDGTLAGRCLVLGRAPLYLRGVLARDGRADALDQLDDSPEVGDVLTAYRRVGEPSSCHVSYTEGGRRRGRWVQGGTYRAVDPQPSQEVMADAEAWRAWACEQGELTRGGA